VHQASQHTESLAICPHVDAIQCRWVWQQINRLSRYQVVTPALDDAIDLALAVSIQLLLSRDGSMALDYREIHDTKPKSSLHN
ncbi:hypothetical protein Q4563_21640, partial [Gilvimarinus sp. 1_MG-2023]|nr:hypothetical protein [Gilvimarinus sp. 1_MG-2023]